MARRHEKTTAERIFENILFLEEVFGDKADTDIPDIPVLELAKCFDLSHPRTYAPREDAGNLRSMEIVRVNYRITEVSDWKSSWDRQFVSRRSLAHGDEEAVKIRFAYPRQFVTQMIPT